MPTPLRAIRPHMLPTTGGPRAADGADGADDVRLAQAGDPLAFERLYRAHAGRVHALALRLTGDRARAAELTQDVFVRAWEKLGDFRGESTLATWLHRLAVNALLQDERGETRRLTRARSALRPDVIPRPGIEAKVDLERAIAALPPQARLVFVLHDVEGYRHEEIARLTGNAPGTLRANLHRARQLLMEALGR